MPGQRKITVSAPSPSRERPTPVVDGAAIEPQALRHDVVNSLTVALGYAAILRRWLPAPSDPRLLSALDAIEDDIRRAYRLMLCDDMRADDDRDLRAVIGRALSQVPAMRAGDVRLRIQTAAPLLGAWDPLRVEQAIANLIDNAAKYSAAGSPIEIEVTASDGEARVAVRDEGIGIAPGDLDLVLDGQRSDLARALAAGNGIGLPLCRRLVAMAGGRLQVHSVPGEGSEFAVILPLLSSAGVSTAADSQESGVTRR